MDRASALLRILVWPNNIATLARIGIVSVVVASIAGGWSMDPAIGVALFVFGYFISDYLDGWLARRLGRCSAFGETLDLLSDRWCDILLAAFLLGHAPEHTPALLAFLLLRIAPEVVIGRFAGAGAGMFTATGARFVGPWITARSMDIAALARTIFFAWALFGVAPAWTGLLIVVPAGLFALFTLRVLSELAAQSLAAHSEHR